MTSLFDLTESAALEKYRRKFYAAGGTLLMHDDAWLEMMQQNGRSAKETAALTRTILAHEFDEFVKRLLAKGSL